jgi:hypothetical protein
MKSVNRRYLRLMGIVWSVSLVLFLLLFIVVLIPQGKRRKNIELEFTKLKSDAEIADKASQESQRQKLNQQIESLETKVGDFVFTAADAGNLPFDISNISSDIGLDAFGISSSGGERIPLYDGCKFLFAKKIQVSFNSGFNKFAAFINALEKHRPVIFINTFVITRSQQGDTPNKVDMELAVLVSKDSKPAGGS